MNPLEAGGPAPSSSGSFLSGIGGSLAGGIGAGLGSMLGGSGYGRWKRQQRKLYKYQLRYQPGIERANILAKVQAYKDAGLHPLAALGISSGGAGTPGVAPPIPGQSETGSAISEGIRTGMSVHAKKKQMAHAERVAGLQVDEQQLRNDWLKEQIRNSKLKRAQVLANATRTSGQGTPGPGPQQAGEIRFSEHASVPTGTTTSSQDAEDRYWEIGGAALGLHNIGYDTAGLYLGSVDDELRRLESAGVLQPPLHAKKDPYRWRKGGYRYVRPPVNRPKYRRPARSYRFEYYNSP